VLVPDLGPTDLLPYRPRRVLVAGTAGVGKTILAARIGAVLGVPHTEIDGLYHGPGWTPRVEFVAEVEAFSAEPAWVTEWQYSMVRPLLLQRCDLLVWLDLPTAQAMRQVIARTLRRRWRQEEMWNGNTEPGLLTIFTDEEHIIRWAWGTRHKTEGLVTAARSDYPELPIVRLTRHRESDRWLAGVLAGAG